MFTSMTCTGCKTRTQYIGQQVALNLRFAVENIANLLLQIVKYLQDKGERVADLLPGEINTAKFAVNSI